jgi:hypothetical protein
MEPASAAETSIIAAHATSEAAVPVTTRRSPPNAGPTQNAADSSPAASVLARSSFAGRTVWCTARMSAGNVGVPAATRANSSKTSNPAADPATSATYNAPMTTPCARPLTAKTRRASYRPAIAPATGEHQIGHQPDGGDRGKPPRLDASAFQRGGDEHEWRTLGDAAEHERPQGAATPALERLTPA